VRFLCGGVRYSSSMRLLRFLCLGVAVALALPASAAGKPNMVIILADDLGWADLGCHGADLHETPSIDRFAAESVRFTQAYAMSVCTPTRATLMTGKHAARSHMTIWSEGALAGPKNRKLIQADSLHDLPHTETTLAKHLQSAGYLTALVGKWHLGDANHFPETHGFDVNIGGTHWGAPHTFFWPYSGAGRFSEFRYVPHLEFGAPGEYLTDRLTDEALRVIDRANGKPFFLYVAHHAVHTPMEAKEADVQHFKEKVRPGMKHQNVVYAAMVKNFDESVGRVLAHLKQRNLEQNTMVIFASDNGGFIGPDKRLTGEVPVTNNAPLRSGKASLYEGGIRIPLFIRWPAAMSKAGECAEPVIVTDLFHTCMDAAGLSPAKELTDGMNLMPLVKEPSAKLQREALYFHYPHYYGTTTPVGAVREGDWKLLEYFEDNKTELYHLKHDPSEVHDVSKAESDRTSAMLKKLREWRATVGANMPKLNPDFRAKKGA
jgi:arylsulfatase A